MLSTSLSPAACVTAIESGAALPAATCPGFLFDAVADARNVCREAGGKLVAATPPNVWQIDVNHDGVLEFVFDNDGIVVCEGAWSVFSCGSLGCPKALVQQRNGVWQTIAGLNAAVPEEIEVLDGAGGYGTLRICHEPCVERWFYDWNGSAYDATRVEVRGFSVDLVATIHGLHALLETTEVLATPDVGAASVGRYDAGTDVVIIGTATTTAHYYVSPCNACESGFVAKAALRIP